MSQKKRENILLSIEAQELKLKKIHMHLEQLRESLASLDKPATTPAKPTKEERQSQSLKDKESYSQKLESFSLPQANFFDSAKTTK